VGTPVGRARRMADNDSYKDMHRAYDYEAQFVEHTMPTASGPFDPETLALLKAVFEEAYALLPPHKRTHEMRSALAVRILKCAANGERNPTRLRAFALVSHNRRTRCPIGASLAHELAATSDGSQARRLSHFQPGHGHPARNLNRHRPPQYKQLPLLNRAARGIRTSQNQSSNFPKSVGISQRPRSPPVTEALRLRRSTWYRPADICSRLKARRFGLSAFRCFQKCQAR
jgi:hypothetical protein